MSFQISYIISTRNRLPFLQITLKTLLSKVTDADEIVVVDGNSNDGTKEYLQELLDNGKIHQLVSEPDKGQAHGWNKAMLLARGTIIKKIIDDDVFDYNAIKKCAIYMLSHPEIDVLISNDLFGSLQNHTKVHKASRISQYQKWLKGAVASFTFGDVHMLVRKSSLAYIGLYNTSYVMMDWEYSLRISYLQANITYYTGYNALSVAHNESISALKNRKEIERQGKKAHSFYEYAGDNAEISLWSKIKIAFGKALCKHKPSKTDFRQEPSANEMVKIYQYLQNQLEATNSGEFVFIKKE
ncbi:glycosyltransferase [Pedobacter sp. HDW13]|uniref:glycosyltransferase n=1 Tax=Pedobacter sp. HDW13 TaxID=2714940 RepID=UPI00140BC05B|nr:glycosyltransferase [Pedobacter sp. HDW13]QIL40668.1 glycosyltransferase [Pedobacter sp. HDW13]